MTASTRVDLAVLGVRGRAPVQRQAGAGPSDDGHLMINGLGAALPINPDSPYLLDRGRISLDGADIGLDVAEIARPRFYDLAALVESARRGGIDLLVLPGATVGGYIPDLRHPGLDDLPPTFTLDSPVIAQDCISANAVGRCVRTIHHLDQFSTPELAACHERAIIEPYAHVCVSAAVAAEVNAGWGLRPTVIGNGVDAARFAAARTDTAGQSRWRARFGRYVLAVGGIEPRKGSVDLLEAYALARLRQPDLQLVFAGGETLFDYRDYRAAFDTRAAELGVHPHVLGPVAHAELPSLVAGCAVFGFVSTQEGFGLAAMEALAADVPVVVRDLPVLVEVFGDYVGYGRDPAEIAAALLAGIDDGGRPGSGKFARGHTWAAAAQAHLRFYDLLSARS